MSNSQQQLKCPSKVFSLEDALTKNYAQTHGDLFCRIMSMNDDRVYWKTNFRGYTNFASQAGVYSIKDAVEYTKVGHPHNDIWLELIDTSESDFIAIRAENEKLKQMLAQEVIARGDFERIFFDDLKLAKEDNAVLKTELNRLENELAFYDAFTLSFLKNEAWADSQKLLVVESENKHLKRDIGNLKQSQSDWERDCREVREWLWEIERIYDQNALPSDFENRDTFTRRVLNRFHIHQKQRGWVFGDGHQTLPAVPVELASLRNDKVQHLQLLAEAKQLIESLQGNRSAARAILTELAPVIDQMKSAIEKTDNHFAALPYDSHPNKFVLACGFGEDAIGLAHDMDIDEANAVISLLNGGVKIITTFPKMLQALGVHNAG